MDSYVVRVYRQDMGTPRKVVGVVEEVGVKGKRAFTNIDDLWEILCAQKGGSMRKTEARNKGKQSGEAAPEAGPASCLRGQGPINRFPMREGG